MSFLLILAQAPTPSAGSALIDWLLSPTGVAAAVAVLGSALGLVLGTNAVRRRRVALAVYHAFHVVEDLDTELNDTKLDKAVAGLKAADEWMRANGWRPLKPGEVEVAKLTFKSMNGAAEAQAITQAKAMDLARPT